MCDYISRSIEANGTGTMRLNTRLPGGNKFCTRGSNRNPASKENHKI